jgi:peptide/nickel transport system ATP-binding protein
MVGTVSPLLSVRDLRVTFPSGGGRFAAVDGVSFDVAPGETICLVGESGSGKSLTALSILGLVEEPGQVSGSIKFEGSELTEAPLSELRRIRGGQIGMIFQEPMTSLNPLFTVGEQIGEALRIHQKLGRREARERAIELLHRVGIPGPRERVDHHPHRLSGGMRQRAMIAMAVACGPALLLADEPTTALDVTIQAQILDLLARLKEETGMAMVLITHDMGVVARVADRVVVLYAGRVAENASVDNLFAAPGHPYSSGLLACIPSIADERETLEVIEGMVPSPADMPRGCRFAPRCRLARGVCEAAPPSLYPVAPGHWAACFAHDPRLRSDFSASPTARIRAEDGR